MEIRVDSEQAGQIVWTPPSSLTRIWEAADPIVAARLQLELERHLASLAHLFTSMTALSGDDLEEVLEELAELMTQFAARLLRRLRR